MPDVGGGVSDPRVETAAKALAADLKYTYPFTAAVGTEWDALHDSDREHARYIAALVLAAADAVECCPQVNGPAAISRSGPRSIGVNAP